MRMIPYLWKKWICNYYTWWRKIIYFPRNFCRFIGELCSFLHNGFPYEAVYDHYWWFLKQTKAQFQRYLKNHWGYPGRGGARTNEEWEGVINQMIGYIDVMLEDEDDDKMLEAKDKFFELYSKWFFSLWD